MRLFVAVLVVLAAAFAAPSAQASWLHAGGSSDNRHDNPRESGLTTSSIGSVERLWWHTSRIDEWSGEYDHASGVVVADGKAFSVMDAYSDAPDSMVALNVIDGSVEWRGTIALGAQDRRRLPAAYGQRLWVPEASGIRVFSTRCGAGWATCSGDVFADVRDVLSVTVTQSTVLAVSRTAQGSTLYAFDRACLRNCAPRWRYSTTLRLSRTASADAGLAWVGRSDNRIMSFPLDCGVAPGATCSPTRRMYVANEQHDFTAEPPALTGDRLYATSTGHVMFAFPTSCGKSLCRPLWRASVSPTSAPAVSGGRVWMLTSGGLDAYDAACTPSAGRCAPVAHYSPSVSAPYYPRGSVSIVGGLVLVPYRGDDFDDGVLVFSRGCTGTCTPLKRVPARTSPAKISHVAVSDDRVFFATEQDIFSGEDPGPFRNDIEAHGLPTG